jgi:hypothetical protein
MESRSGSDARPLVDVTLIDEMLALTPAERLRQNDRTIRMIENLRRGLATDRPEPPPR